MGVDWQPAANWVFESRLSWHRIDDLYWSTDQFDADGRIFRDVRSWKDGFREYRGLAMAVRRSLRNDWTVLANYTLGRVEGNMASFNDDDDLFEGLGGLEVGSGATDATVVHRLGRTNWDRTHILNLAGSKRWPIGRHDVGAGLFFEFSSGERWGFRPFTTLAHPVSGQRIRTTTYREARDAQQLEDTFSLNLTADWRFSAGVVGVRLGFEVVNLTNEQEVVRMSIVNGRPLPGIAAFQLPRELRLLLGLSF